jgi:amino-acid N-acetyltransferase
MMEEEVSEAALEGIALRKATVKDVRTMARIINGFAAQGQMLPKSQHQLYQDVRDFVVAAAGDEIVGCGALHIVWEDLAEVRSLAVIEAYQGKGVGQLMLVFLIQEARSLGLPQVFALTYRDGFFGRMGFHVVPREALPHKIWGDCLNCPKFPNCDEIAMVLDLNGQIKEEAKSHAEG